MKQRIVIKVPLNSHKHTAKVMQIASVTYGVTSIAINGEEKDQVEVIGDGVDPVKLTISIRKKVSRNASLVVVEELQPQHQLQTPTPSAPWSSNYYLNQSYRPPGYAYESVYNPSPPTHMPLHYSMGCPCTPGRS